MIKALGERIILRPIEEENKTKSGIVLNDSKPKQECFAEVIDIDAELAFAHGINAGDKVIYPKVAVLPVELDGEKYIIANVNDILAVIK